MVWDISLSSSGVCRGFRGSYNLSIGLYYVLYRRYVLYGGGVGLGSRLGGVMLFKIFRPLSLSLGVGLLYSIDVRLLYLLLGDMFWYVLDRGCDGVLSGVGHNRRGLLRVYLRWLSILVGVHRYLVGLWFGYVSGYDGLVLGFKGVRLVRWIGSNRCIWGRGVLGGVLSSYYSDSGFHNELGYWDRVNHILSSSGRRCIRGLYNDGWVGLCYYSCNDLSMLARLRRFEGLYGFYSIDGSVVKLDWSLCLGLLEDYVFGVGSNKRLDMSLLRSDCELHRAVQRWKL